MFEEFEENILFNDVQIKIDAQDRSHVECLRSATVRNLLRVWMVQWSCGRFWSCIRVVLTCGLKMRVSAWLLCVSSLYTWAEFSQSCTCQDICATEPGLDKRSKTRVKEHVRHSVGHQHAFHRSRPHRRKGERLTHTTFQTEAQITVVLSCKACAFRCKGKYPCNNRQTYISLAKISC